MLKERYVSNRADFVKLCADLAGFARLGFDTEFIGENSFHPRLCLVQVATEEGLYIIDPLGVGTLEPFWEVIADPRREVIVHAGREEVRLCHRFCGKPIGNLFDLQLAAGLTGYGYPLSYGNLMRELFGVHLSKAETLTDWGRRPLTREQVRYAYDDVRYLLAAQRELRHRLEEFGRLPWAEEEFRRLAQSAEQEAELPTEKWRRINGAGKLTRRQLAVLRELYQWREATAFRLNCPPGSLCRDKLLVKLARMNPRWESDLKPIRGLPYAHLSAILQAIEKARALPPEALPEPTPREVQVPELNHLTNVLTAVVHELSKDLQIAPQLVATSTDLRSFIKKCLFGEECKPTLLDVGWRKEHVRGLLVELLSGKAMLRIRSRKAKLQPGIPVLEILDAARTEPRSANENSSPPFNE